MTKSIDLGRSLNDFMGMPSPVSPDDPHYPDLMLSDVDEPALAEMPDKGEATIKYRVVSRTHREEGTGKKRRTCSLRLEILAITPPERKKKNGGNGYGDDARKSLTDYFKGK